MDVLKNGIDLGQIGLDVGIHGRGARQKLILAEPQAPSWELLQGDSPARRLLRPHPSMAGAGTERSTTLSFPISRWQSRAAGTSTFSLFAAC